MDSFWNIQHLTDPIRAPCYDSLTAHWKVRQWHKSTQIYDSHKIASIMIKKKKRNGFLSRISVMVKLSQNEFTWCWRRNSIMCIYCSVFLCFVVVVVAVVASFLCWHTGIEIRFTSTRKGWVPPELKEVLRSAFVELFQSVCLTDDIKPTLAVLFIDYFLFFLGWGWVTWGHWKPVYVL